MIYIIYGIAALFGSMMVGMFMDNNEQAKTKLLVFLCIYLVMLIFRADVVRWVEFKEFCKAPRKSMWGAQPVNQQQQ